MNAAKRRRIHLFDTTLRDGQQTHGAGFSLEDKRCIATALDALGVDSIEGGWPGANPVDDGFFSEPPPLKQATFTAFGMTRRTGRSASNDATFGAVVNAGTKAVCLVGKADIFEATDIPGVSRAGVALRDAGKERGATSWRVGARYDPEALRKRTPWEKAP